MICYVLAMGKQHLRPRAVVGYGIKIFLPRPLHYVTRSPGSECRVKECREKDVHGCSNIADLNTGVSLHSSPVLMETVDLQ